MIKYPVPLKKGDTIGVTAPSSGVTGFFSRKMDNSIRQLQDLGYNIIETPSVRKQKKGTSATAEMRAGEFTSLYLDKEVRAIIPPWGGEFLMDMLPYLDFKELADSEPKWIMGFSDTSTLLFALTLRLYLATVHGPNLLDFGCMPVDQSVLASLKYLNTAPGDSFKQKSLEKYQEEWLEVTEEYFPPYNLTEKVKWEIMGNKNTVEMEGRLLGGNLDVICKLIGTPYSPVKPFINDYSSDGFIWYFESCEMNAGDIYRTLWQMKMNGWFDNCHGFIYGRAEECGDLKDFTYIDALEFALAELNIPVVYNADIGHLPPQLTLINGAYAKIKVADGNGYIEQRLKT